MKWTQLNAVHDSLCCVHVAVDRRLSIEWTIFSQLTANAIVGVLSILRLRVTMLIATLVFAAAVAVGQYVDDGTDDGSLEFQYIVAEEEEVGSVCLLYTSPSPRD